MARIVATENITLDGVMQGVGRADEDTRGDFTHGGWGTGYPDEVSMSFMGDGMAGTAAMLFGRRTYEDLMAHWTTADEPNPFTDYLLRTPKYVASHSPSTELAYPESTLLTGAASTTVARLREELDGTLGIIGSGTLVRTLHAAGLIDGYVLLIHPIVLGSGARLFDEGKRTDLRLERSVTSTTGVVIAQYSVPLSSR